MIRIGVLSNDKIFLRWLPEFYFRQNGAPSGLEKRGLDASIYHKTRKPTEGTKSRSQNYLSKKLKAMIELAR